MTGSEPSPTTPAAAQERRRQLALVTGASSGIGRAFAERMARDGVDLVLTARDAGRLQEIAADLNRRYGVSVRVLPGDLAAPETPHRIMETLAREGLVLSILINDAGFNVHGRFEDTDLGRELDMIALHVRAVTVLTKLFLAQRDRTRANRILNVASLAALVPGPRVSVHFATRAYIHSFTLALAEEHRGTDVSVTSLCPGPVQSDFFNRAGMTGVRLARGWPIRVMTPEAVAEVGYLGLCRGREMVVPGLLNRALAIFATHAPRRMAIRFTSWVMDIP